MCVCVCLEVVVTWRGRQGREGGTGNGEWGTAKGQRGTEWMWVVEKEGHSEEGCRRLWDKTSANYRDVHCRAELGGRGGVVVVVTVCEACVVRVCAKVVWCG